MSSPGSDNRRREQRQQHAVKSATAGDAPRSAAASSYCLPIKKNTRPRTITTT